MGEQRRDTEGRLYYVTTHDITNPYLIKTRRQTRYVKCDTKRTTGARIYGGNQLTVKSDAHPLGWAKIVPGYSNAGPHRPAGR